jgi:hypothetical protein
MNCPDDFLTSVLSTSPVGQNNGMVDLNGWVSLMCSNLLEKEASIVIWLIAIVQGKSTMDGFDRLVAVE